MIREQHDADALVTRGGAQAEQRQSHEPGAGGRAKSRPHVPSLAHDDHRIPVGRATHDLALSAAARASGFEVVGVK